MKKCFVAFVALIISISLLSGCISETIQKNIPQTLWAFKSETDFISADSYNQSHIDAMNICKKYVDEYYFAEIAEGESKLKASSEELEIINKNISYVTDKHIFFSAFADSDFQDYMESWEGYYKNGGKYDESFVRYEIYNRMISVRLKVLLHLERYEEFTDLFVETFNTRSFLIDGEHMFYKYDDYINSSPEAVQALVDAYEKVFELAKLKQEKAEVVVWFMRVIGCDAKDETDYAETMERLRGIADPTSEEHTNNLFFGFTCEELNPDREFYYVKSYYEKG